MSSKRTTSPASRDSVSCTIAIDRIRRSDSSMRGLRLGRLQPAALEPEQRGDRLQVVLHPVVDLADGRVLRQQQAVAAAEVGDVAQQHEHADDLVALEQRDRLHQQRRLAPLDLLGDRAAGRGWRRRPRPGRSPSPPGAAPTCTSGCPCRCIELTAFGLAKRTRRSGSRRITPSPTRGASSNSSSSWRNGKRALGDHRARSGRRPRGSGARARRAAGRAWGGSPW